MVGFGLRLQEGLENSSQRSVNSSNNSKKRARIRRLLHQLDPAQVVHNQLRNLLCFSRGTLASKEVKIDALVVDVYYLSHDRGRRASNTNDVQEPKRGRALDVRRAFVFH